MIIHTLMRRAVLVLLCLAPAVSEAYANPPPGDPWEGDRNCNSTYGDADDAWGGLDCPIDGQQYICGQFANSTCAGGVAPDDDDQIIDYMLIDPPVGFPLATADRNCNSNRGARPHMLRYGPNDGVNNVDDPDAEGLCVDIERTNNSCENSEIVPLRSCDDYIDLNPGDDLAAICRAAVPGQPSPLAPDSDGDGFGDACDNCPLVANNQVDAPDNDGVGNACDNCPLVTNPNQADSDEDGLGDACDEYPTCDQSRDGDGDGIGDCWDRCPTGLDSADLDADGVPDACDAWPLCDNGADGDGDGVPDACDRCAAQHDDHDADLDGVADGCDICPGLDDGSADAALDTDGDGVCNFADTCPEDATDDSDADGVCDSADRCAGHDDAIDADRDARPDACDEWPACHDEYDRDHDGIPDGCDICADDGTNMCLTPAPPAPGPTPDPVPTPEPPLGGCSASSPGTDPGLLVLLALAVALAVVRPRRSTAP